MSSKPWFAFYPGDYAAKTQSLSMLEHGAYFLLLREYYTTGHPLPQEATRILNIVKASREHEVNATTYVLERFFTLEQDGCYHNKRVDREIQKQTAFKAEQSRKGKLGGKPKHSRGLTESKPNESLPLSQPQPQVQRSKPLASSDKSLLAGEAVNGDAVEYIPLVGGSQWGVSQEFLAELERAYPAVDGPATLKEIRAWCVSNPNRCKTKTGVGRFLNTWFAKVQNHG